MPDDVIAFPTDTLMLRVQGSDVRRLSLYDPTLAAVTAGNFHIRFRGFLDEPRVEVPPWAFVAQIIIVTRWEEKVATLDLRRGDDSYAIEELVYREDLFSRL